MKACVFTNSMLVLVNGGVTKDFVVERGLRQEGPLSPFLFVMAAEGLTRLVKRAVEIGEYVDFHSTRISKSTFFSLPKIPLFSRMVTTTIYGA